MSRRGTAAIIVQVMAWIGGSAVTFGGISHPAVWYVYAGMVATLASGVLALYIELVLIKKLHKEWADLTIEAAVQGFLGNKACHIRCNFMTYYPFRGFKIQSWYGEYPKEERKLYWGYNVGVAGKAALAKKIAWGRDELESLYQNSTLPEAAGSEGVNTFGMSEAHFRATRRLRTIVAVPVMTRNGDVVAVICLDDRASSEKSILNTRKKDVERFLWGLAGLLGERYNKV